ncbi:MAG: enoyl-CoA hydratase-related protein [Paracoccaceae bacterium]|nr:enoyl-CoA hydratase-related protein [Paracoccaceae bacterium]
MEYKTLDLIIEDNLAIIKFTRPAVLNALNSQMRAEILHAVKYSETRARCLVITGEGRAFCSGQDLGDRSSLSDIDLKKTLRDEYEPMLKAIYECEIPTIAAVNGVAAGAGANLALCADVVIATESASFIQAFSKIGLIPDAGGSYFLPRKIGLAKSIGAAFFAEKISAKEASLIGLIWECVNDELFAFQWTERAVYLANGPTQAFIRAKKAIKESFNNTLEEQLKLEANLQGECGKTYDFKEGVLAFLDKRNPNFEGR